VLSCQIRRDGANSTVALAACVRRSRFYPQLHAVLLQGIAFAGFNVVDIHTLREMLGIPVLVVSRRRPNLASIRSALLDHVRGGARKWSLIEKAGPMEALEGLLVQRSGLSLAEAGRLLRSVRTNGKLPEPLRTAHLIAGGVTLGESRSRA
jgi:hypothetical protein